MLKDLEPELSRSQTITGLETQLEAPIVSMRDKCYSCTHTQTSYAIIYTLARQKNSKEPEVVLIIKKEGNSGMHHLGISREVTASFASVYYPVLLLAAKTYVPQDNLDGGVILA